MFPSVKKVFFVGIGGIGVSAVARMFLHEGKEVFGSDASQSEITDELIKLGAKIEIGQGMSLIPKECDLIIYTAAIEKYATDFLAELKASPIQSLSYPEALQEISRGKYTIAVAGTHGKTTTTAMIAKILIDAGLDPTVIVGSLLLDQKSNFIAGKGKYLVVEADDYRRAFLKLEFKLLVITNIGEDHLDYYKDINDIKSAFTELVKKIPRDDTLVTNTGDAAISQIICDANCKIVDYPSEEAFELSVPGRHNEMNAKAAFSVARVLGLHAKKTKESLKEFKGTWRRFEYKGKTAEGALVYDDYAHNPSKVKAALQGAREKFPDKKIIAVFQPHLYSRTKTQLADFAQSFENADEVMLLPIFGAREESDPTITSEMLVERLKKNNVKAEFCSDFDQATSELTKISGAVIMLIGAGNVYKIAEKIVTARGT